MYVKPYISDRLLFILQPGIFQAVKAHNVEKVKELLQCWCKMDSKYVGVQFIQLPLAIYFNLIYIYI